MLKYNMDLIDSTEYYIIDISKIYSLKRNIWADITETEIEIETKENGLYILNQSEFENFNKNPKIIIKFKPSNWCTINVFSLSEIEFKKTKKAFKHLVSLYGGKIIDDLF